MNIILFGKPGSGKSTYAHIIIKGQYLAPGEMLRTEVESQTELGVQIGQLIERGEFAPDRLTNKLIYNKLISNSRENMIFDGYPRNIEQAKHLQELCKKLKFNIEHALYLDASDEIIIERLKNRRVCKACKRSYNIKSPSLQPDKSGNCYCGGKLILREDDKEKCVVRRLNIYRDRTECLKDFYKKILVVIQTTRSIESDVKEILKYY